jgi:hypothetical protein
MRTTLRCPSRVRRGVPLAEDQNRISIAALVAHGGSLFFHFIYRVDCPVWVGTADSPEALGLVLRAHLIIKRVLGDHDRPGLQCGREG